MKDRREEFIDTLAGVGVPPEGVDFLTYVIAEIPSRELNSLIRANSITYETIVQAKNKDHELYKLITEEPHPIPAQAQELKTKQLELSKFRRRIAVVASAGACAVGGFIIGYSASDRLSDEINKDFQEQQLPYYADDTKEEHAEVGAIIGGTSGALGGFLAYFGALGMAGAFAHSRAKKIVNDNRKLS